MSLAEGLASKCDEYYMMLFKLIILDKRCREGP